MKDSRSVGIAADVPLQALLELNRMSTMASVVPNVAHDVNNALQIIGGLVELLSRSDLPADVRQRLERIGTQSVRATAAMRQLVAYVRPEPRDASRRVDLRRVVEQVLTFRRYHLSRNGIDLRLILPDTAVDVRGEAHALEQVVLNLVLNAEQALAGRDRAEMRLEVMAEGAWGTLDVSDNGPGLEAAARQQAAVPLQRASARRAGLGLWAAETIAASQQGRLDFVEVPTGTRVRLRLPLAL